MRYLLDTCALSEMTQKTPDPNVLEFLDSLPVDATFVSTLSLGEVWKGIELLVTGERKVILRAWFDRDLSARFDGKIIPVDFSIACRWGQLAAVHEKKGRKLPVIDALIAATALEHGLTVVTRNEKDFEVEGLRTVNPWPHNPD